MRVGMVVDNEYSNDVRVTKEVELLKKRHEVFVLCFDFGSAEDNSPYIDRVRINMKLKDLLYGTMVRIPIYEWLWTSWIKKFIKKHKIEVVHTHDLYMSKAAYKATSKFNIPLILDLHENYPVAVNSYNWTKSPFKKII